MTIVISELVEGRKLSEFLHVQRNHALSTFEALHVLHTLVRGIAPIHARGEYHGDIHDDNIIIRRAGIGFEVKLIDFFDLGRPNRWKIHKDVLNLIEVFHTIVGGRERYAKQPKVVKDIIRGQKDSLILDRFQSVATKVDQGQGTAGKLINDPKLYEALLDSSQELSLTIKDLKRLVEQWEQEGVSLKLGGKK